MTSIIKIWRLFFLTICLCVLSFVNIFALDSSRWIQVGLNSRYTQTFIDIQTVQYEPITNVAYYWIKHTKLNNNNSQFEPQSLSHEYINFDYNTLNLVGEAKYINGTLNPEEPTTYAPEGTRFNIFPGSQEEAIANIVSDISKIPHIYKTTSDQWRLAGSTNYSGNIYVDHVNVKLDKKNNTATIYYKEAKSPTDSGRIGSAKCNFKEKTIEYMEGYDITYSKPKTIVPETVGEILYNKARYYYSLNT